MEKMLSAQSKFATAYLTKSELEVVIIGCLFIIGLLVAALPVLLARKHKVNEFKSTITRPDGTEQTITSFFQIPYVTWFLTHYVIGIISLIAIIALGITRILTESTIAALIGSLLGYTLGSAAGHGAASAASNASVATPPASRDKTPKPRS